MMQTRRWGTIFFMALGSGCGAEVADAGGAGTDSLEQAVSVTPPAIARVQRGTPAVAAAAAAIAPVLVWNNGPIIQNVKVISVMWGSNVNNTVAQRIGDFYATIVNHPYLDWVGSEYSTPPANPTNNIQRGSLGGNFTIQPSNKAATLTDAQIQTELAAQISAGKLPLPDANSLYMVHFPAGSVIQAGRSVSCGVNEGDFCAYHSSVVKAIAKQDRTIYYGVMPDFGAGSGCDTGCGAGVMFDNFTSTASHEVIEAVTDPVPYSGWGAVAGMNTNEIGDLCNQQHATIRSAAGIEYTVQKEWSNAASACVLRRDSDWSFAWVDTNGEVDPDYSGNSSGELPAAISRNDSPGNYEISFQNIGEVEGGNVQVVAYGSGSEYCNVGTWFSSGINLSVNVLCFSADGSPVNTQFSVSYERFSDPATAANMDAYVLLGNPAGDDTGDKYQWNSTGASNGVVLNSTGNYAVTLPGVAAPDLGGNVLVTAYGGANRCKVQSWYQVGSDILATVACSAPSGDAANSGFSLRYGRLRTIAAKSSAYAWLGIPDNDFFTPPSFYQYGFQMGTGTLPSITAGHYATGQYFVTIPKLSPVHSTTMVTAYGGGSEYCKVGTWFGSGDGTEVDVACFTPDGAFVDSLFVISYADRDNVLPF